MIETLDQLRALYPAATERARRKQMAGLDPHAQRFIALSPFCVLASSGGAGQLLDASPRGGPPGFVKCRDAQTLLLPDVSGNNRLDTLENLLQDPRLSLLFLVPGVDETLRVNGHARLRDEAEVCALFAGERRLPQLVIEITVQEAYLHCPKAFMRSALWQAPAPDQAPRQGLPTLGQMIHDQIGLDTPPETQAEMLARYQAQLRQEQAD